MHQDMPLVVTLAAALGLALMLGFVAARLRLPALIGYLLAGVLIGPYTPGFVADGGLASQLAEVGVMLLMFGVGLHFSIDDLLAVRRIALPGAMVQMVTATAFGAGLALYWGWTMAAALVFGIALSVASTVVLLRALEARGELASPKGRIAVGWLVVEDLAMVIVLVLMPVLVGVQRGGSLAEVWTTLARTLLAVAAFVALMLLAGRRVLPWMLWQIARTRSRELFTLCVVAAAVSIAVGAAALFGVSVALGAFFAGLVLRESSFGQRAAEESLPFRDAFAVLFFVAVGMLFDPRVLIDRPLEVLAVVAIIIVGKSIAATLLVLALRYRLATALTVAASLAQIGEFSFMLATLGNQIGVLSAQAQSLIVAGAIASIALNPLVFHLVDPIGRWAVAVSCFARRLETRAEPLAALPASTGEAYLSAQVVLVGYGAVGREVAAALAARAIPFVVVEGNRDRVEALRGAGFAAVAGDATDPSILVQAHVATARLLVVATPETTGTRAMMEIARSLNPSIAIVVRAPNAEEAALLGSAGADVAIHAQGALAGAMAGATLARAARVPAPA